MKRIFEFGLIAIVLSAFTFTSCSNNLPKKVQNIVMKNNGKDYCVISFDSEGRLLNLKKKYRNTEFKYLDSSINFIENGGTECGFANIEKDRIVVSPNGKFSYSPNGYLKSIVSFGSEEYNIPSKEIFNIIVENGKISKCKMNDNDLTFLYGNACNNLNVDLSYLFFLFYDDVWTVLTNRLGERLDYLPSAIYENNKLNVKFSYEYDGKYLSKIVMGNESDNYSFELYYE